MRTSGMGRIGIISDIHSNLHALRAALDRLGELDVRTIVCLGDIVGYGPHPVDCLNGDHRRQP
jgi:predicted phosphodiesterase